jgi:hypothetical protein
VTATINYKIKTGTFAYELLINPIICRKVFRIYLGPLIKLCESSEHFFFIKDFRARNCFHITDSEFVIFGIHSSGEISFFAVFLYVLRKVKIVENDAIKMLIAFFSETNFDEETIFICVLTRRSFCFKIFFSYIYCTQSLFRP